MIENHAGRLLMLSFFFLQVVGTLFTHHQKCVIVDSQATGNNRKITAFIGGLDLCDGRYDTPEHRLFKDLDTVFKKDFHNPTFPVSHLFRILLGYRCPSSFVHTLLKYWKLKMKKKSFSLCSDTNSSIF